jgi:hypothetical protein
MNYDKHGSTAKEQADHLFFLLHAILNIVACVLND